MMRPPHFCAAPGCNALITTGSRCALHQTAQRRAQDERKDLASVALYSSARWRAASRMYRAKHPLCVRCGGLSECVDHIKPHRGDPMLFWAVDNWQALCTRCNAVKRHEDAVRYPTLHEGPPA